MGSYYLMGKVSFWDNEKVLEMDADAGCTTVWMYLMPVNCTFKIVKMVNFVLYRTYRIELIELYQNKEKWKKRESAVLAQFGFR